MYSIWCIVKLQIFVEFNGAVIHEFHVAKLSKKNGLDSSIPLGLFALMMFYVFSIPMLRKVKERIHDPLNWTYQPDANVSCSLMLQDAQTRINILPSAPMNEL